MTIINYEPKHYGFGDDYSNQYPALVTKGCGCCSSYLPVTQQNLEQAISEAEEWLETLRSLSPVDYSSVDLD